MALQFLASPLGRDWQLRFCSEANEAASSPGFTLSLPSVSALARQKSSFLQLNAQV